MMNAQASNVAGNGKAARKAARAESVDTIRKAAEAAAQNEAAHKAEILAAAEALLSERAAVAEAARAEAAAAAEAEYQKRESARAAEAARPLAQKNGAAVFEYCKAAALRPYLPAAAALLVACNGNKERAAALLGDNSAILADLHVATELVSVLSKAAPREFFGDDYTNADSVRIGDLHASTFGLSKLYRATNKAALKAARTAARKLIDKAE